MKKVYIAGSINASNVCDVLSNLREGISIGSKLLSLGYAPFTPHLDFLFALVNEEKNQSSLEQYREYSKEWLASSDIMLVISGRNSSAGVMDEINFAIEKGIHVYFGIDEFMNQHKMSCEAVGRVD